MRAKFQDNVPRMSNEQPPILVQHSPHGTLETNWMCPFKDTQNCEDSSCNGVTEKKCDKWLMSSAR